jgi:hypothetical protein
LVLPAKGEATRGILRGGNDAAKRFFDQLSAGAIKVEQKGKVTIATMPDGQRIVYRSTSSSDGTPVVEIHGNGNLRQQKIHFID